MKRILLKIAYDGRNYEGWQGSNKNLSIESILNKAISKATNEDIHIIGASRTDSKVHANANIAVFDTNSDILSDKFTYVLNNLLPNDISILESYEVSPSFHPRKCKSIKTYVYKIHSTKVRNPLKERDAHFVYYDVNIDRMKDASKYLIGTHDFMSFINPESQRIEQAKKLNIPLSDVTTKSIYSIDITKDDDIIIITISGNGFLYHMVRIICGTLLKIGMGMWEPSYMQTVLEKKDRRFAGFTLPGIGLTLQNIEYIK